MAPVSVILITRNEAHNLAACLERLHWADEIVVVDAQSQDGTAELARQSRARVFEVPWMGFSAAKSFALSQCSNHWVLWVDADERVTDELAREIQQVLNQTPLVSGFRIARKAYFLGRWIRHGGWYPGYVCRLFVRDRARFNGALVHESVIVDGPLADLQSPLEHYTDDNLEQYIQKMNHYTSLAAQQLYQQGRRFRLLDLVLRPPFTFLKMYLLRCGFLDGLEGFILAVLSAGHVLLKYAKLWWLEQQAGEPARKGAGIRHDKTLRGGYHL